MHVVDDVAVVDDDGDDDVVVVGGGGGGKGGDDVSLPICWDMCFILIWVCLKRTVIRKFGMRELMVMIAHLMLGLLIFRQALFIIVGAQGFDFLPRYGSWLIPSIIDASATDLHCVSSNLAELAINCKPFVHFHLR